jgi:hypothetical protein
VGLIAPGGSALAAPAKGANRGGTTPADHSLVGAWLLTFSTGIAPSYFGADGTALISWPACEQGTDGLVRYTTPGLGTWECVDERKGYVNVVQVLSDAEGYFLGSRSLHCYPVVSEDGESFEDDGQAIRVYVRDGANSLADILGKDGDSAPMSGVRMRPGSPGFPGQSGSIAEQ